MDKRAQEHADGEKLRAEWKTACQTNREYVGLFEGQSIVLHFRTTDRSGRITAEFFAPDQPRTRKRYYGTVVDDPETKGLLLELVAFPIGSRTTSHPLLQTTDERRIRLRLNGTILEGLDSKGIEWILKPKT